MPVAIFVQVCMPLSPQANLRGDTQLGLSLCSHIYRLQGWRFAFFVVAAIAAAAGVVTVGLGVDPRLTVRSSATSDKRLASIIAAAFSAAWTSFRAVLRVRTFQVLVLQVDPLAETDRETTVILPCTH